MLACEGFSQYLLTMHKRDRYLERPQLARPSS